MPKWRLSKCSQQPHRRSCPAPGGSWPESKLLLMMGSHFTKSSHYLGATSEFNLSKRGKRKTHLGLPVVDSRDWLKHACHHRATETDFLLALPACLPLEPEAGESS